jgi:kinesin family member 5
MFERVRAPFDTSNSNIRVVVKIRPPNEREKALEGGVIVSVSDDGQQVIVTGKPPFTYDVAFPMECSQLEVFEKIGVDIVATAYNGYNASMFAYGQTSSGKSFSMMGVRGTSLVGLIPRISNLLFYCISKTPEHEFFVEGSYLEIYNEKLRDLIATTGGEDLKVEPIYTHLRS